MSVAPVTGGPDTGRPDTGGWDIDRIKSAIAALDAAMAAAADACERIYANRLVNDSQIRLRLSAAWSVDGADAFEAVASGPYGRVGPKSAHERLALELAGSKVAQRLDGVVAAMDGLLHSFDMARMHRTLKGQHEPMLSWNVSGRRRGGDTADVILPLVSEHIAAAVKAGRSRGSPPFWRTYALQVIDQPGLRSFFHAPDDREALLLASSMTDHLSARAQGKKPKTSLHRIEYISEV